MNDYIFRAAVKDQEILLLDKEGMVYMGQRITDAGEAGAAWIQTMKMLQESAMQEPLSDEEIESVISNHRFAYGVDITAYRFARAVEKKVLEKMHGIGEAE